MEYQNLLQSFKQFGFNRQSKLTQYTLFQTLNKISFKNNDCEFNTDIALQLWNQSCNNLSKQELANNSIMQISVKKFIGTIIQARKIIQKNINELKIRIQELESNQQQNSTNQNPNLMLHRKNTEVHIKDKNKKQKRKLKDQMAQWLQVYKKMGLLFPKPKIPQSNSQNKNTSKIEHTNLNNSQSNKSISESNQPLLLLFILTIFLFFVELFLMVHKFNFLNIMITLFLSFIFALRYFDRFYIKFLLVLTFLGILLDIFWIVMKFKTYWNLESGMEVHGISSFYKCIWILSIILGFLKCLIFGILVKYRQNNQNKRIDFGDMQLYLNGQVDLNEISVILQTMFKMD